MGQVAVGTGVEALLGALVSRAGRDDPYPVYAELRREAPVAPASDGSLLLTRFADCSDALRNPDVGHGDPAAAAEVAGRADWRDHLSLWQFQTSMLSIDPPAHTRVRRLVSGAFTPRRVAGLRPVIAAVTDRLLADMPAEADFIAAFAFPLPIAVIGELLGVPPVDQPRFQHLAHDWTKVLDVSTPRILAAADAAAQEIRDYLRWLVGQRRSDPRDDLISAMLIESGPDTLTADELLTTAALLFAAGFETATHLLGNGLVALLGHPDQLETWLRRPDLDDAAVDELLRFDSPVQMARRIVLRDTVIGGVPAPAGQRLMACLGAANRDPERFSDPDRLDLRRAQGQPMSFGAGIHYCLGAALARLEGRIAFPALFRRFPALSISGPPHRRVSLTVRGYLRLPVSTT